MLIYATIPKELLINLNWRIKNSFVFLFLELLSSVPYLLPQNSSDESLIRSFQLAFSLRDIALNEGGKLPICLLFYLSPTNFNIWILDKKISGWFILSMISVHDCNTLSIDETKVQFGCKHCIRNEFILDNAMVNCLEIRHIKKMLRYFCCELNH